MNYKTQNNKTVVVDKASEEHLTAHPEILSLLEESISRVVIPEGLGFYECEVRMNREVGICGLVKTVKIEPDEQTDFIYRKARLFPSRIVLGQKGQPCDTVTLSVKKAGDNWRLVTAFIGYICPDEPYYIKDKNSDVFRKAFSFWTEHALVYNPDTADGEVFKSTWDRELNRPPRS